MELWVYNEQFDHIGILDTFDTAMFDWRYCAISKCTIYAKFTKKTNEMLSGIKYISKAPINENGAYFCELFAIVAIRYSINETREAVMECDCEALSSILAYRYVKRNGYFDNTNYQSIITSLFNGAFKDSTNNANGLIAALALQYAVTLPGSVTGDVFGQSLYDVFRTLLLLKECGFRVRTNIGEKLHYLEIYQGQNLTLPNNLYAVSVENERLLVPELIIDKRDLYTNAFGRFEKDGTAYFPTASTTSASSWKYRELYIPINVQETKADDTGEKYTLQEMQNIGAAAVLEELKKHKQLVTFSCNVVPEDYGDKYTLGDVIAVQMPAWNFNENIRVTGVAETYNAEGRHIELIIGAEERNLLEQIKVVK